MARTGKSGQAALEMLVTYSWALLVLTIVLATVLILPALTSGSSYFPPICYITPLLPCQDTILTSNAVSVQYYVVFINNLQTPLHFNANSFVLSNSISSSGSGYAPQGFPGYNGICSPKIALPGVVVTCNVTISGQKLSLPQGGLRNTVFRVLYQVCSPGNIIACLNSTAPIYNTSGYASQSVGSPANLSVILLKTSIYNGIGNVLGTYGLAYIGGLPYTNGSKIFLTAGNYVLYAKPPAGNVLSLFGVQPSGAIVFGNTAPANFTTVIKLLPNKSPILLVNFTKGTAVITSTSTSVTSTSSTSLTSTSSTSSTTAASTTSTSSTSSTQSTTSTSSTSVSSTSSTSTVTYAPVPCDIEICPYNATFYSDNGYTPITGNDSGASSYYDSYCSDNSSGTCYFLSSIAYPSLTESNYTVGGYNFTQACSNSCPAVTNATDPDACYSVLTCVGRICHPTTVYPYYCS